MTPEEIESKFGKEALRRLYDSALNNPVHDLVNRIFHYKTEQEIADASRILLAAQESAWGPIADEGLLHDRASYRYFWTILKRAQQTGRPIPPAAQHAFFRI